MPDYFVARLEVAQHLADRTGQVDELLVLLNEARTELGEDCVTGFLVECTIEEIRSKSRSAAASVTAWRELHDRAGRHLEDGHTTMMSIRSYEARYVRARGAVGDLDEGVRLYEKELALRTEILGAHNYRTCITRANLAVALRDRGTADDLKRSLGLLREEVAARTAMCGAHHEFTQQARTNQVRTLLSLHEVTPDGDVHATEALNLVSSLIGQHEQRLGRHHRTTLTAYMLRAQALRLCGRSAEAARDLEYVRAAIHNWGIDVEPAWPTL
ncbi:hypothetical protein QEZ54_17855 [Catellatospora sp. KI3]|uniref:hypothetical protein n=1 Tax=Catellatospora sp. KI3 TaxID=3041620 RepID=UPI002482435C|nr:hypothetical protein [Catellatospora sp. KI3]MDI1462844.1 hypothetical protein [Catellatospora sp. KI3]